MNESVNVWISALWYQSKIVLMSSVVLEDI